MALRHGYCWEESRLWLALVPKPLPPCCAFAAQCCDDASWGDAIGVWETKEQKLAIAAAVGATGSRRRIEWRATLQLLWFSGVGEQRLERRTCSYQLKLQLAAPSPEWLLFGDETASVIRKAIRRQTHANRKLVKKRICSAFAVARQVCGTQGEKRTSKRKHTLQQVMH
jgi:hypothetical protein